MTPSLRKPTLIWWLNYNEICRDESIYEVNLYGPCCGERPKTFEKDPQAPLRAAGHIHIVTNLRFMTVF